MPECGEYCPRCHDVGYTTRRGEDGASRLIPCACMSPARKAEAKRNCNLPGIFRDARFDAFDPELYGAMNQAAARSALGAARSFVERFDAVRAATRGRGLYLVSKTKGSGKTLLASALVNELIERDVRARFVGMLEFLSAIKDSYDPDSNASEAAIIGTATHVPVLVIDDMGVERQTPWVNETVYRLLDERLSAGRPTVFTSNVEVDALQYDDRVKSRIEGMACAIRLPEESVRGKLARVSDLQMRALLEGRP